MNGKSSYISGASAILCYAALCFSVYDTMLRYSAQAQINASLVPLALLLILVYSADRLLCARTINLSLYAGINIAFSAGICFVFWKTTVLEPFGIFRMVIGCIICCAMAAVCAVMAQSPPEAASAVIRVDILAGFLLAAVFLEPLGAVQGSGESLTALAAALLLQFPALNAGNRSLRAVPEVQGSKAGGALILGAILAAILGAAALIAIFFSGSAHSISQLLVMAAKAILGGVKALVLLLFRAFEAFMSWLASLLPESGGDAELPPPVQSISEEAVVYEQIPVPGWFYAVLAGLAAFVLLFIFRKMSRVRISRVKAASRPAMETRSGGLKDAFSDMLRAMRKGLRLAYLRVRYRKSAPALLLFVEARSKGGDARLTGESGEAFLRRLAAAKTDKGPENAAQASALLQLANLVESGFYSKRDERLKPVPEELYRNIRSL